MGPNDIISAGDALGKLGVIGLLGAYSIGITWVVIKLWREGNTDRKEAGATNIALLREQYSDAGRRKDLFDKIGDSIDAQAQATRDFRNDFVNSRQDFASFKQEFGRLLQDIDTIRSDLQRRS
jgi:ABC-type transporter Mla subunit MlaD